MSVLVKVVFIFIIFAVNNTSAPPPPPRSIPRTNSAPELNILRTTATRSHDRANASPSTSTKARNNVHFQSQSDVARRLSEDLNQALLSTTGEHLNPSRDGYYSHVNRVLAQYGVGAVVGTAIGIGAVELYNLTNTKWTTTTSTSTTTEENVF